MDRRQFISISTTGLSIGIAGCIENSNTQGAGQDASPSVEWETSEGHTEAMGGDWVVIFTHSGGDTIDTSESSLRAVHDNNDHDIEREVRFMDHEEGDSYREGDELIIVIPESEPQIEFGESFAIEWAANNSEWYVIGEHLWGQHYRNDVP